MNCFLCCECGDLHDADKESPIEREDGGIVCDACQQKSTCQGCGEWGESLFRGWHRECWKDEKAERMFDARRDER